MFISKVGHKEPRFTVPFLPLCFVMAAQSLEDFKYKFLRKENLIFKIGLTAFLLIGFGVHFNAMFNGRGFMAGDIIQ